jgi:hypothetical protein
MYDFNRGHLTTTLEGFYADDWGSTFFFTDIYHPTDFSFPTGYYTEIARGFNFWKESAIGALSLHAEWNGGLGNPHRAAALVQHRPALRLPQPQHRRRGRTGLRLHRRLAQRLRFP